MAHYAYKDAVYSIPSHYVDTFEQRHGREHDYDSNYDGDYWISASEYIDDLESRISEYEKILGMDYSAAVDKLEELKDKKVWE